MAALAAPSISRAILRLSVRLGQLATRAAARQVGAVAKKGAGLLTRFTGVGSTPGTTHSAGRRLAPMAAQHHTRDCEMTSDSASALAARLMSEFATRTGLSPAARDQQRYLWTDAFAVCNFLELFRRTDDEKYRRCATQLIDKVHQVLGRYRDDDMRSGWISGLDEETGRRHPTAGGLRIGKPLQERDASEPVDERLEWDRDGQYFHYLTKWMHALCQTAFVTGDPGNARWAVELGEAAFGGFVRRSHSGEIVGVYWKMSTDLSRPLVPAMGLHDALDGFITFRQAQHAGKTLGNAGVTGLSAAVELLSVLCQYRNSTTDDPLGLGGLLFDACRLCRLPAEERFNDVRLLEELTDACHNGLIAFLASRQLNRPASHRLAFRELGLAIGLRALPIIADAVTKDRSRFGSRPALRRAVDLLCHTNRLARRSSVSGCRTRSIMMRAGKPTKISKTSCLQRR
jgi:hypothetical protein